MSESLAFDNNAVIHDSFHGKYSEATIISMNNSKNFENGRSNSMDPIPRSRKRKVESLKEHLDYTISSAKSNGNQEDLREATRDQNRHKKPKDDMNPLRCASAQTLSPSNQVSSDMNKHLKDIINKAILCYGNKKDTSTSSVQSNDAPTGKNSCLEFTPDSVQSFEEIPSLQINKEVSPGICIEIHVPEWNEVQSTVSPETCIKSNKRQMNRRHIDTSRCAEIKLSSSCVSHEPKDDRKNDLLEYIPALNLKTSMGMLDRNAQMNKNGLFHISQWDALQHLMKCDHSSVKNLYSPFVECQNPYSSIPIFTSHTPKLQASIGREYQAAAVATQTAGLFLNSNDINASKAVSAISHQELYTPSIISTSDDGHPKEETNSRKHSSILLYSDKDDNMLSPYQCLIRKQIEIFTAGRIDVESTAQGRNSPIRLGQVGIRCKHCSMLPPQHRTKASTYYPSKLLGVYQAAQNIAVTHLSGQCPLIPDDIREDLIQLHTLNKATPGRGKVYWANSIQLFGLYESDGMIMLDKTKVPST